MHFAVDQKVIMSISRSAPRCTAHSDPSNTTHILYDRKIHVEQISWSSFILRPLYDADTEGFTALAGEILYCVVIYGKEQAWNPQKLKRGYKTGEK